MAAKLWVQHEEKDDGGAVCAHGAVMTCQGLRPGDAQVIRAVMRAKGLTEAWNDEPGRTKAQVLAAMSAIEVSDGDLAEVFGPQWRRVVALVRRVAALTGDEVMKLAAAWYAAGAAARYAAGDAAEDAARYAAWNTAGAAAWYAAGAAARYAARYAAGDAARYAARDAARYAAGDAARYAAWNTARYAAWNTAGAAARDAAWAVSASDLVGQYGLAQNHIDTLMAPWIAGVGEDWEDSE